MSLTAVIPVWNGRDLLARLLDSLETQTLRPDPILVVDNGSTDGAPDLARERGARVLRVGFNSGFARAVNLGIMAARTEWIAIFNSDVDLAPDYCERLIATGAQFATGKILGRDGNVDGAFDLLCRGGTAWRGGSGRTDSPPFDSPRAIASAPLTAAIFRRAVFDKTGLLEDSFESYLEDVDFGLRCAASGIEGIYEPAAVARHFGSASLGRWSAPMVRLIARNQVLLVARRYPRTVLRRWWWPIVAAQGLWGLVAARHGAGLAWCQGKLQGLCAASRARELPGLIEPESLQTTLSRQEELLRSLQYASGYDLYWRLYFFLTGDEA
jgi:GT2 family glycosyltransferase